MDIKTSNEISAEERKVERVKRSEKHKVWIGTYIILGLVCITVYLLIRLKFFGFLQAYRDLLLKLSLAAFFSFLVLIVAKMVEGLVVKHSHTKALVYNFVRLIHFITILIIAFIVISFINNNWYSAAVSLVLFR